MLSVADALLRARERPESTVPARQQPTPVMPARVGIGYDAHRFASGRRLVLGGVEIAHQRGLEGHSDADVLLHALADAILGAAALGDIGQHFPPADERFRDADSRDLLREVVRLVGAAGWKPANVDATILAEEPRINPHVPLMRERIAACLGLAPDAVGVKATTNEGMGAIGRGEGIAALFAQEGARVVVADIQPDAANRVADAIRRGGGEAEAVIADVTRDADTAAMIDRATSRFGRLDVLVNNAGVTHVNQPMTEVSEADFDRVYAVNVKSLFWAARHAVPVLRRGGGGAIVNTASTAGLRPRPGLTWYNGSKGAAVLITKSMAVELAPDKIRVNALCPVAGETPLLASFMGGDTPELRAKFRASVPLGRLSTPLDVARAALFLASDDAEFLTGVCLEVDGGRCI